MAFFDEKVGAEVLLEVSDVLDHIGIPFFLMQGTALGAYRDNGFTPTERDIDLGVLMEHLPVRMFYRLMLLFIESGYDVEAFVAPFDRPRTLVLFKNEIKVDIVTWAKWKGQRFQSAPVREYVKPPYCIVHEAKMLEKYRPVNVFGKTFNAPYNIEEYLRKEYGDDWKTPQEDHVSRTRVYDFIEKEGIPYDYLSTQS
jgi:hypothetical protein